MRAFLMAAGTGTRLKDLTQNPKSILKVNDKTIIRNTVEMLRKKNIETYIIVGFKDQMIKDELKDFPEVKFIYNDEYIKSNSIVSLYKVKDKLTEDSIIANADVFWDDDLLEKLLDFDDFKNAVMLGDKSRIEDGDYFLKTKANKIVDYGKELELKERTCEYVGVSKIRKEFLEVFNHKLEELISNNKLNFWWENVLYELSPEYDIYVKDVDGIFWGEVDTIKDYNRILEYMKGKEE